MKFLFGAKRVGRISNRGYFAETNKVTGTKRFFTNRVDFFQLWGISFRNTFIGLIVKRKA